MITDSELSALIAEGAEAIPEPTGADAILAAAVPRSTPHRSLHRWSTPVGTHTRLCDVGAWSRGGARHRDHRRSVLVLFAAERHASSISKSALGLMSTPSARGTADHGGCFKLQYHVSDQHEVGELAEDRHHRHALACRPRECARSHRRRAAGDRHVAGRVRLVLQRGPRRLESWWHRRARCSSWRIPKSGERDRVTGHLETPEHDRDRRDRSGR